MPNAYSTRWNQSPIESVNPSIFAVILSPNTTLIAAVPFAPRFGQMVTDPKRTTRRTTIITAATIPRTATAFV